MLRKLLEGPALTPSHGRDARHVAETLEYEDPRTLPTVALHSDGPAFARPTGSMDVRETLAGAPALRGADEELLAKLSRAAVHRELIAGQTLWSVGERPTSVAVVRTGLLKLVRPARRRKESVCGIVGPPRCLGGLAALLGAPHFETAVAGANGAEVVCIVRDTLLDAARRSPTLATSLGHSISEDIDELDEKVEVLAAGSVQARLARLMLRLYERHGSQSEGVSSIPVVLSRRDLAEYVATCSETVTRVMTRWSRERVLATTDVGFTILDHAALKAAASLA